MLTIIERARRYIAKCPVSVSGQCGHNAAFHVASLLVHGFGLGEADALRLLAEWNQGCVPPWSEAELIHKVRSAAKAQHSGVRGALAHGHSSDGPSSPAITLPPPVPKPEFKPEALKRIAHKVAGIGDVVGLLGRRSSVRPETQNAASVLRRLYARGSGERVLIFSDMESQGQFLWEADRSEVIQNQHLPSGDDGVWFLPQPVDGLFHPNPRLDNKMSRRSEESVTAWRYVVLESDKAEVEDWLRCLIQMPLRIACVCESGGRSIHALVRVDASSKADWDEAVGAIKPILITLGADRGALSAVRLSRLPHAQRGERVQRLLYLNPEPDGRPIVEQAGKGPFYAQLPSPVYDTKERKAFR